MNNQWLVGGLVTAIVVLLGVIAFGAYAFTQQSAVTNGAGWMMNNPAMTAMMNSRGAGMMYGRGEGMMGGRGFRRGFTSQNSLLAIAAKDLNLNMTDLLTQLQSGKSIVDIAKEKNVATDKIVDDFLAAHSAQMKAAVDAKWMTQAEADAMLAMAKAHAQAQITRQTTAQAFGSRPLGGQNMPMMRGGFGGGGMMGPRSGWR